MKVSLIIILIFINNNYLFGQLNITGTDSVIVDTLLPETLDTLPSLEFNRRHSITGGLAVAHFNATTPQQVRYNLNYQTQVNPNWNLSGSIALINQQTDRSEQYTMSIQRRLSKGGLGLTIAKSDDILAPQSHQQLNYYTSVNEGLILSGSISRFTSSTRSDVWPSSISITRVINSIGYSFSVSHDLSLLSQLSPLVKASVTFESKKGDILSSYFLIGTTRQPNFLINAQSIETKQLALGGWFKKHLSKRISLIGALGLTSVSNNDGNKLQIINTSFSITTKL